MSIKVLDLVQRSNLPRPVRYLAATLATYADDLGRNVRPGLRRLARELDCRERNVQKGLKLLQEKYGVLRLTPNQPVSMARDGSMQAAGGQGVVSVYEFDLVALAEIPWSARETAADAPDEGVDLLTYLDRKGEPQCTLSDSAEGDFDSQRVHSSAPFADPDDEQRVHSSARKGALQCAGHLDLPDPSGSVTGQERTGAYAPVIARARTDQTGLAPGVDALTPLQELAAAAAEEIADMPKNPGPVIDANAYRATRAQQAGFASVEDLDQTTAKGVDLLRATLETIQATPARATRREQRRKAAQDRLGTPQPSREENVG